MNLQESKDNLLKEVSTPSGNLDYQGEEIPFLDEVDAKILGLKLNLQQEFICATPMLLDKSKLIV